MTPKILLRDYLIWRIDVGAQGLDPIDSEGDYALKQCDTCRFRKRHYSGKKRKWVCGRCGEEWPMRPKVMFKGEVQTSQDPDGPERFLTRMTSVGVLYQKMLDDPGWEWPARLLAAQVLGEDVLAMVQNGATIFGSRWPRFSLRTIERRLSHGRKEWAKRCAEAELC